jgi:hypothetical protein
MENASRGGIQIGIRRSSGADGAAVGPALDAMQLLYFLLLIPAIMVCLLTLGTYAPLDPLLAMGSMICAFVLSAVARLWNIRNPSNNAGAWRTVSTCAGFAIPVIALLVFLNGNLDKSPREEVRATVLEKTAPIGFREAQYGLRVTSWRPGKKIEDLNVGSRVFERAVIGKNVIVELHQGFFGMMWYGKITPE